MRVTAPPEQPTAQRTATRRGSHLLTAALAAAFVLAGVTVLVALDGSVTRSADPGAAASHIGWGWLAAGLALALCWVTSRRVGPSAATPGPRIGADLVLLIGCALAFPLVIQLPVGWHPADYVWIKALLLLLVPGVALWLLHRRVGPGVRFPRPALGALAVLGALAGIAAHQGLLQFGPGSSRTDFGQYDLATLVIAATATAVTASIGEEIFYRYWLQTRLEATLGRWPGILATSLMFGLMHLASHGAGLGLGLAAATVVAGQGVAGILFGYLWSRYRRLWLPILLHLSMNGLMVLLHLAGLGG